MRGYYYVKASDSYSVVSGKWFYANVEFTITDRWLVSLEDWIAVYDYESGNGLVFEGRIKSMNIDRGNIRAYIIKYALEFLKGKNVYLLANVTDLQVKKSLTSSADEVRFKLPLGLSIVFDVGDIISVYVSGLENEYAHCRITTVTQKDVGTVDYVAHSRGYELTRVYVRKIYYDTAPEEIVRDLVESNSDLKVSYVPTGETLSRVVVDDYIYNVILFLAEGYKYQVRVVGDTLYFEPFGYIKSGLQIDKTFGGFTSVKNDISKLVNELWLYGSEITYNTQETFTGDGTNIVFTVSKPVYGGVRVEIDGVEVSPNEYDVRKEDAQIIFNTAPTSGATITIYYQYQVPITIHVSDDDSVSRYGRRGKKIVAKFIDSFEKARDYVFEYLREFADPNTTVKVATAIQKMVKYGIEIGIEYQVTNEMYGLDENLVVVEVTVKSNGMVEVVFGEIDFDVIEWYKKVEERLSQLERLIEAKITLTEYKAFSEDISVGFRRRLRERLSKSMSDSISVAMIPIVMQSITNKFADAMNIGIVERHSQTVTSKYTDSVGIGLSAIFTQSATDKFADSVSVGFDDKFYIVVSGIYAKDKVLGKYVLGS